MSGQQLTARLPGKTGRGTESPSRERNVADRTGSKKITSGK